MRYRRIPDEAVRRLPLYLRALAYFAQRGDRSVSSSSLAEFVGVNAGQIRKDISYFGVFGTPGVGYGVDNLTLQVRKILKLTTVHRAAIVGVGNLGSALMAYPGFRTYGFDIAVAFDSDRRKVGKVINKVRIEDAAGLGSLRRRRVNLGIITVPREAAQETADGLVRAGVKGILNFSGCYLNVPRNVKVVTIDIATELARLPYYMPAG
jgi:redox-sensing transcriptional repressor